MDFVYKKFDANISKISIIAHDSSKHNIVTNLKKTIMIQKTSILLFFLLSSFFIHAQTSLPDISLKNIDGQLVSLKEISKDKVLV
ncbi:MAG: hypothetical protein KAH07_07910, partial [Flavobacteriaceae bacterium]|nr:hypothetical protein [Flavobacteriaceae bacterium]